MHQKQETKSFKSERTSKDKQEQATIKQTRTINKDYTLGEFKPGCFNLAKKSKCKIVLSCTRYTDLVNKGLLFKRHKVFYDIIGIIDYEEYKDMNTIELSKLCHDKIEEYLKERIK